jgi:hypothetical protein
MERENRQLQLNRLAWLQLSCQRTPFNERASITIAETDDTNSVTLPWQAYTPEGAPVDLLRTLQTEVTDLRKQIDSLTGQFSNGRLDKLTKLADSITEIGGTRTCFRNPVWRAIVCFEEANMTAYFDNSTRGAADRTLMNAP